MRYLGKGSVSSLLGVLLNIAWYVLFAAMGGILLAMLVLGVLAPRFIPQDLMSFTVDAQFLSFDFSQVEVKDPQVILFGNMGFALTSLLVVQAIVHQLRKVFATLRAGTPFNLENAKRIRAIGLICIGGSFLQSLVSFLVGYLLMNNVIIKGVEVNAKGGSFMGGIFIGLVILVLAEIFRHGAALQEEQNLTV
ncbi:MAG: DUF2975 domain-containing protein [Bacteroidota bacterium]